MSQPNDICISESGMVFASDPDWKTSTGRIWRCEENGVLRLIARDHGTVNGIEISPDERILYVNESVQRKIWAYDLTIGSDLKRKRLFTEFSDFGLDGMRCDVAGNLYVTRYGKGTILKLSPHGKALKEIKLHGAKPSNLAFGGEDGKTVYVTEVEQGRVEQFQVEEPGREWKLLR
jgi:sugar lactone lactonase YvrE